MTDVFVAFGANLGDPAGLYPTVARRLAGLPGVHRVRSSRPYRTRPVGGPAGQPEFLNGCFALDVAPEIDPAAFHTRIAELESEFGRTRDQAWSARPIDLDLLLFGERVIANESLLVPHPRLHYRAFVLDPLAELAPAARHPLLGLTIGELAVRARARDSRFLLVGATGAELAATAATDQDRWTGIPRELWNDLRTVFVGPVPIGIGFPVEAVGSLSYSRTNLWAVLFTDLPAGSAADKRNELIIPAVDCRAPSAEQRALDWRNFLDSLQSVVECP